MRPNALAAGIASAFCTLTLLSAAADQTERPMVQFEPDPSLRAEVATRLGSGRYGFCTDENYRLWQVDKDRMCLHAAEVSADCPGLVAACARPAWDETSEETTSDPGWLVNFANFLGAFGGEIFRGLFWLALAVGAFLLARALFRLVKVGSGDGETTELVAATAVTDIDPTSQPASVLLQRAAELLESGDSRRALHFAYAALLAGLDHAGLVRVHRALTTGDYRRLLSRSSPKNPAGGLLWDLDLARFRQAVDGEGARHLTSRVREVLATLAGLLLMVGVSGLSGCASAADRDAPAGPTGPRGYALFEELLATRAVTLTRRLRRITELPEHTTAVLVMGGHLRKLEWQTIERYVESGGHLIVAGRAHGMREVLGLGQDPSSCTGPIKMAGIDVTTPDSHEVALDALGPGIGEVLLATCGSLDFARIHAHGQGQVTLVGDAGIFDNTSLALGDNASFALAILGVTGGHIEFIGPWTGAGAVHPLESVARSSVGWWLLHLLLAVGLFAWARGRRFGSPRPKAAAARRSQIEHAEALASHYKRQGDTGAALGRYSHWALGLLGKRSGSSNRDLRALAESLASRRGVRGQGTDAKELHQILLRARAGAQLGGDKAKLMRAYGVLRTVVAEVTGRK